LPRASACSTKACIREQRPHAYRQARLLLLDHQIHQVRLRVLKQAGPFQLNLTFVRGVHGHLIL